MARAWAIGIQAGLYLGQSQSSSTIPGTYPSASRLFSRGLSPKGHVSVRPWHFSSSREQAASSARMFPELL